MKSHIRTLYGSLSLLAITNVFARPAVWAQESLEDRIASVANTGILGKGVPGVSVAVMRDGEMLLERAWGMADMERNVSASTSTTYPVGSVTKQFTAALLLKQVDRGRLTVSESVGKHLPNLSDQVSAITIEQLLNHTSGLRRLVTLPERRFENMPVETLLAMAVRDNPTNRGTRYEYSNAGYTILGVLVEKLYGKPYAAALHDEISEPLGLPTLTKCAEPTPHQAAGYGLVPAPWTTLTAAGAQLGPPPGIHHSQGLGAVGVCSTAGDLVRWTHALHSGRVLTSASYQAMTTPRGAAIPVGYGFGLRVGTAAWGEKAIAHGGQSLTGHVAELHWYPEHKVAVALLYNVFPYVPGISDLVPRIVLGVPLPEKKP